MLNEVKHLGIAGETPYRIEFMLPPRPDPSLPLRMTEGGHGHHKV
jgi:hypothetical protein